MKKLTVLSVTVFYLFCSGCKKESVLRQPERTPNVQVNILYTLERIRLDGFSGRTFGIYDIVFNLQSLDSNVVMLKSFDRDSAFLTQHGTTFSDKYAVFISDDSVQMLEPFMMTLEKGKKTVCSFHGVTQLSLDKSGNPQSDSVCLSLKTLTFAYKSDTTKKYPVVINKKTNWLGL